MYFNAKILEFPNGTYQIKYFKNPIITGYKKEPNEDEEKDSIEDSDRSLRNSLNRTINTVHMYSRSNVWDWFITFTIADSNIRYDYELSCKKLRKWLNNIKYRYCPTMSYLFVPERHQDGAYHFHGLVRGVNELHFDIAINNKQYNHDGTPNKYYQDQLRICYPNGDFIYNIREFSNGWSTATRIKDSSKASNYILKYITKDLIINTPNAHRYFKSNNLELPNEYNYFVSEEELKRIIEENKWTIAFQKEIEINSPSYENKVKIIEIN